MNTNHRVELFVALPAEARSLITHFKLKKHSDQPFRRYANQDISLTVTGLGKLNAAAAVGWRLAQINNTAYALLNLGIAGHALADIGSPCIAHKVIDHSTAINWYPSLSLNTSLASKTLECHDKVVSQYPTDDVMVDMESSGIWQSATHFLSLELIQSVKIISDNAQNPLSENINTALVVDLIAQNIPQIEATLNALYRLLKHVPDLSKCLSLQAEIESKWRFSSTQTNQLERLLQRLDSLDRLTMIPSDQLSACQHSKQVMTLLETMLK